MDGKQLTVANLLRRCKQLWYPHMGNRRPIYSSQLPRCDPLYIIDNKIVAKTYQKPDNLFLYLPASSVYMT